MHEPPRPPSLILLYPRSLKQLNGYLQGMIRGRLWLQVLIAMALGLATGIAIGPSAGWVSPDIGRDIGNWLAFPGQLFLALIQMIVIPLVFTSIIRGLAATEDLEQLRQTGLRVVLYFLATTVVAIIIGLVLAVVVRPGHYVDVSGLGSVVPAEPATTVRNGFDPALLVNLPETMLSLLPDNPLGSMVQSEMLQVVIFAAVVGVALVMMPPAQSRPLLDLAGSLQEVCMTVVRWAMRLAPIAVFGLLAQLTAKVGLGALVGLAVYVATVLAGLLLLMALYLTLAWFVAERRPQGFLAASRELLLLAFSTSSSAAVMPLSIKLSEEKFSVRPSISQFVIPLGATINMNGTALYQGVAALFLAQVFGVDVGLGQLVLIVVTAVGASIGAPATPGVGIVILSMVLTSIGVPPAGIALIMGVDRILDMSRTAINVAGDLVAALLMERWVGGKGAAREAIAAEAEREQRRATHGGDTLIEHP